VLRHQIEIKKKTHFVKKDDINGFTWFTLQTKSATEMGWWFVHRNLDK
jgi:hypothetical protein